MNAKPKILLVDDERAITDNLAPLLERSGFAVAVAPDGARGLDVLADFGPDLVVLDVLMPALDGREMLRQMRQAGNWTPVILLTQVGESVERTLALNEGADDYLNKPFDAAELIARIRSVLRRSRAQQTTLAAARRLVSGELTLERASRRVRLAGEEVALTPKAVTLLEYLMTHPDELIARDRLLDVVWGWDYPAGIRAVDTRIAELRKALGDDPTHPSYIETMPGQGYRFLGTVEALP
ncbi:MAG: response regulator transcription factor [Anaerolineales bacterium]